MNTKIRLGLGAVLLLSFVAHLEAVQITNFGTPSFTVDGPTTNFTTWTQTISSITLIGNDTHTMAGTFTPFDSSGLPTITLTGFITGVNPLSQFFVELYDDSLTEIRTYSGFLTGFGSLPSTVTLTFVTETASFSLIGGFQITGAGAGDSLNLTLTSLDAVPEPSTYLLLVFGGLALWAWRRRHVRE